MLKKKILDKLNQQLNFEYFSANIYLQMSAWAENNKYAGAASFLKEQALEEQMHMLKFFDYINERGNVALIGKVDEPMVNYKSLPDIFKAALEHERKVTKRIHDITQLAWEDKDLTTFNFMQWFVTEQHEEETQFEGILDKFDLVGKDERGLFMLDQELKERAAARTTEA